MDVKLECIKRAPKTLKWGARSLKTYEDPFLRSGCIVFWSLHNLSYIRHITTRILEQCMEQSSEEHDSETQILSISVHVQQVLLKPAEMT